MEAIINYIDKYTTQIFVLQVGILFILSAIIMWVYYSNRKKYHNLKHQIPASVVKNYLDSIIQNSTALKSSLFRGGGLDVDPSSIPSVMPLDQLQTSTPVAITPSSGGDEELLAEVSRLKSQLAEKENIIKELEVRNSDLNETVLAKQERIEELEKLLAEAQAAGDKSGDESGEAALQAQLVEITTERDQLKEELAQYDIIEDDLADLKRLKQENEQLKSSLAMEDTPSTSTEEEVPEPVVAEAEIAAEAPVTEELDVAAPEVEAPPDDTIPEVAEAGDSKEKESKSDDKSPEDLLSEFEKMLG